MDTSGSEKYSSLSASYYRGVHGCILCFDTTNSKSLDNLNSWRKDFLEHRNPEDPNNFPYLLLGTKNDLDGNRTVL